MGQPRVPPRCRPRPTPHRRRSRRSLTSRYSSLPFRPSARAGVPTMPSADSYLPVSKDFPALRPNGSQAGLPGSVFTPSVHQRRIDKTRPPGGEDFVVPCPRVPSVSRLVSGSCASPRPCAPRCFQTPPRGDALAVHCSFGFPRLERGLTPLGVKTCPAHTAQAERRGGC
jgi:hypothetical protein